MSKLLNFEHRYIITATLAAAMPQILVTGWFAVWWLDNINYREWSVPFLVVVGYYSLAVASVWVCCAVVCVKKGRPSLSDYMLPAVSVAAVMSLAGVSLSFIVAGLEAFTLIILASSLSLLGVDIAVDVIMRRRNAARKMIGSDVRRANR